MPSSRTAQVIALSCASFLQASALALAVGGSVYSAFATLEDPMSWVGAVLGLLLLSLGAFTTSNLPIRVDRTTLVLATPAALCFLNARIHALAGLGMLFVCTWVGLATIAAWRHTLTAPDGLQPSVPE